MAQLQVGTPVLEVDVDGTTATLTWTQNGRDPNTFEVLRDSTVIATKLKTARSHTDAGLTPGAVHVYQVRAVKGGFSELSNPVTVTVPPIVVPLTASVLTGTAGDTQCSLSWTAVANATSYTLQRKTGVGGTYAALTPPTGTNVLLFSDTGRTNATTYYYRVRGTASGGSGPWSNERDLTPDAAKPVAPTLDGTEGDSENTLDWNAVANAATYRLRRQVGTGPFTIWDGLTATDYIDDGVANDITYQYTVRGITAGGVLGSVSNAVDLTPVAAIPPEVPAIVGYAAMAGVSGGGDDGEVMEVSTWAQFKTAVAAGNARIIKPIGTAHINGNGEEIVLDNGNCTIDGTGWHGAFKSFGLRIKASNVILRNLRLRPGENVANQGSGAGLMINPGVGNTLTRVLVDHCSVMWPVDVSLNLFNNAGDVTIQHSIIGPGLRKSSNFPDTSPNPGLHGYGFNLHSDVVAQRRVTAYRNFMPLNAARMIRGYGVDGMEYVNNVIYGWGEWVGKGNPLGMNVVGNIFKKRTGGPASNQVWLNEPKDDYPNEIGNSTYMKFSGANANIGLTAAGAAFTPTANFGATSERPTNMYGGGLHGVTALPATSALADEIVAAAGPDYEDSIDAILKANYAAGDGDYWNGVSGAAPHPSWPSF